MRLRRILVTLGAVLTPALAAPAAGQSVSQEEIKALNDVAGYLEIVRQYREGDFKAATALLLDWKESAVTKAVDAMCSLRRRLASPPASRDDLDVADVEAAVLLHSEAAAKAWEFPQPLADQRASPQSQTSFGVPRTGRRSPVAYHVENAARIVEWLAEGLRSNAAGRDSRIDPSIRRMVHRDWYLSMARMLVGMMEPDLALSLLRTAEVRFPDDPELLLTSGSAHETAARIIEIRAKLRRVSSPREQMAAATDLARATDHRRSAERDFRRILKIDPNFAEARLRLGRVLFQTRRPAEAEKELRGLLSSAIDPYIHHMGALFLGLVLDANQKPAEAADLYREAVKLEPDCQACRVALAHALDRLGNAQQSEEVLMQFLRQTDAKSDTADPWWIYPYGQQIAGEELFATLRDGVRR